MSRACVVSFVGLFAFSVATTSRAQPVADDPGQPTPTPHRAPPAAPQPPPPPSSSFEHLMQQLRAPDPLVRQGAANQLGQLRDPRAASALIAALNGDGEARVRAAAAYALGSLRATSAGPHLMRASRHERDPQVRDAANYALSQLGLGGAGAPGGRRMMSKKELHRYLNETDEEYSSASGRKLGGILLASIGGGIGLGIGVIAGMVYGLTSISVSGETSDAREGARNWMIGGFIGMGVSLAVGIPLAVSGNSRMKEIRRERASGPYPAYLPRVTVALGGQGGQLGLTWAF